jgi:hypothetical protein
MTKAYVRSAVGASVLSTMLLIGSSAAIAAADPEATGDTAGQSQSTDAAGVGGQSPNSAGAGTAIRPRFDLNASIRQSIIDLRTALSPAQRPQWAAGIRPGSSTPDTGATPELTLPGTGTESDIDLAAGAPEADSTLPGVIDPLLTTTTVGSSNSQPAVPAPAVSPPPAKVTTVKAPLPFEKLPAVARTVGNTVAAVLTSTQQTVFAVPTLLVGLPTSTTPVGDVISTIEFMLTSMTGSVGVVLALPGELSTLMGVGTQPTPVILAGPQARTTMLAGPVDLPGLMMPQLPAAPLGAGADIAAPATPALAPVTPLSVEQMAPIAEAPLGVSGLTASGAPESFLDRAVSTLLVPISIATLAAVALPGVGGLLIICALGVRIGYRQAKAGWAVRVSGISRFAGSGPMGVVRSGSMITLHMPRVTRSRKAGELRLADRSFEQAA